MDVFIWDCLGFLQSISVLLKLLIHFHVVVKRLKSSKLMSESYMNAHTLEVTQVFLTNRDGSGWGCLLSGQGWTEFNEFNEPIPLIFFHCP